MRFRGSSIAPGVSSGHPGHDREFSNDSATGRKPFRAKEPRTHIPVQNDGQGVPTRRLPNVFDGMIDKLFGPIKSRAADVPIVPKTHEARPPRTRSLSAGITRRGPGRQASQNRHALRIIESGKHRVAFPNLKEGGDSDSLGDKVTNGVFFRSTAAFEREDTLSDTISSEIIIKASSSISSMWKGKKIGLKGRLRSNREPTRSRSASPSAISAFNVVVDTHVDVVEDPFTSQATLRAGTSEDLLKSGIEPGKNCPAMSLLASTSVPQLSTIRSPSVLLPEQEARVSVYIDVSSEDLQDQLHYSQTSTEANQAPLLRPISTAEADHGLVPLAIQPEPLPISHLQPQIKSRGTSSISFFNSLRRSAATRSQGNLSRTSSIKSKTSHHDIDSDGRQYRSCQGVNHTHSPWSKTTADFENESQGWSRSFASSSSFLYANSTQKDSSSEIVVIESPSGASPSSPPSSYLMSAKRESAEEVGSSTTSSSRRSVQDVSQSQLSSNKSTTHLAVSVEGATIVASKRSRSVDFGLHRIRSLSTQPTPTSTQPPSVNTQYASLPRGPMSISTSSQYGSLSRNPVSNSSASLRSRRPPQPHQVVETTTIYDKHEQPTRVVSPHGQPEDSQGKVNQYLILRDIGRGSFGRVVLCRDDLYRRYFACKIISKSRLKRQFRFSNDHLSSVKKEIAILKKLSRHPNINALVEVLSDDNEDNLYMIFELCEYGPVMNLKTNETVRPFDENLARKYFRDMILGIEYLHKKHVIHRDLKPENLLLTADMVVQIADFGISHMFDGQDDSLEDKNASPAFCPPEACDSKAPRISGKAFDMWSLGVTLYCMVHGRCPFEDESIMEVYRKIIEEEPMISPHLSPALKDLMRGLMEKDAYNRWKLEDVRRCDWITDFGRDPLISVEQNCDFETSVTDQEIEDAFSPLSKLITRIKNILTFKRKNSSKSNAVGVSPVDDAKAKSSSNISLPSKGILRRNSGTSTERIA